MEKLEWVYLSGPMTGLPDFNRAAFREAEAALLARGFAVENPANIEGDESDPWEIWMRKALVMMLRCSAVVMLDGFQRSKGAMLEFHVAAQLGMPIYAFLPGRLQEIRPNIETVVMSHSPT